MVSQKALCLIVAGYNAFGKVCEALSAVLHDNAKLYKKLVKSKSK